MFELGTILSIDLSLMNGVVIMKESMLVFILIIFLLGCENNKGQYRHDTSHHKKAQQNINN